MLSASGAVTGAWETLGTVATTSSDSKARYAAAMGGFVAARTAISWLLLCALLLASSWGAALASLWQRPSAAPSLARSLGPLGLGLLGGAALRTASGPGAAGVFLAASLGLALAGVRSPQKSRGERATVALLGALACSACWLGQHWLLRAGALQAALTAPPEARRALAAQLNAGPTWENAGLLLAAGLLLLAGAPAPPRWRADKRPVVAALGNAALLGALCALSAYAEKPMAAVARRVLTQADLRVGALAELGLQLPSTRSWSHVTPAVTLTIAAQHVRMEGRVVAALADASQLRDGMLWPAFEELDLLLTPIRDRTQDRILASGLRAERVNLEAEGTLRVGQLEPVLQAVSGAGANQLCIVAQGPDGQLRCAGIELSGARHPSAGQRWPAPGERPDRYTAPEERHLVSPCIIVEHPPALQLTLQLRPGEYALSGSAELALVLGDQRRASNTAALQALLRRVKDEYPDLFDITLQPSAELSLAELVRVMDASAHDEDQLEDGKPRPLFLFARLELGASE